MLHGSKPHNCLIGIGIPLSREQFINDLRPDLDKDFAKCRARKMRLNEAALWAIDYSPMVRLVEKICRDLSKLGVSVITDFKFTDIEKIENKEVFTLVAHWDEKRNMVELNDEMLSTDAFVDRIPKGFSGIFDLTICHSINLQTAIKKKYSNLVLANQHAASIEYRLITYKYCMHYLAAMNCSYIDAVAATRKNVFPND